tara:strand:+ start:106 stop:609 length:504 start_codon:yes stop_codon:yes gene_type:complete
LWPGKAENQFRVGKIKTFNMKKIFTILCAGILTLGLSAQTDGGSMTIETSTGLTADFSDDLVLDLNLDGGYFVVDNLAVMARISLMSAEETDFGFGIGARYYMGKMFGGVMYAIPGEDQSNLDITVGYLWMLTDNVSVQPMFEYSMDMENTDADARMELAVGFGLYF